MPNLLDTPKRSYVAWCATSGVQRGQGVERWLIEHGAEFDDEEIAAFRASMGA